MNLKHELIQSHITEMVRALQEDNTVDYSTIADTNAIIILDKIRKIIADDSLSDFDVVEEIVCILEKNNIDCGGETRFLKYCIVFFTL